VAIEVHAPGKSCVLDATSRRDGCKPMSGVPPTFVHFNRTACTGHLCAYWGGHRRTWPERTTHRVVRASTTRPEGAVGASQAGWSAEHLCITTAYVHWPFVRVLGWKWKYVTIEVHTPGSACVHDVTSGRGGFKSKWMVRRTFVHPNRAACTGHSCAFWSGHRRMRP